MPANYEIDATERVNLKLCIRLRSVLKDEQVAGYLKI